MPRLDRGQYPRHGHGVGEGQLQAYVENDVGGNRQRGHHGYGHGQHSRNEQLPPNGLQEPGNIQLIQAHQEEKDENAYVQQYLKVVFRVNQAGDRPQDYPGDGIGEDGTDTEPLEQALQQLGHNQEQPNGKKSVKYFHAPTAFSG